MRIGATECLALSAGTITSPWRSYTSGIARVAWFVSSNSLFAGSCAERKPAKQPRDPGRGQDTRAACMWVSRKHTSSGAPLPLRSSRCYWPCKRGWGCGEAFFLQCVSISVASLIAMVVITQECMITFDHFGVGWGDYLKNGRGKGVSYLCYRPSVPPVACSEMGSSPSAQHSSSLSPGQAGHRTGSTQHRTHVERGLGQPGIGHER